MATKKTKKLETDSIDIYCVKCQKTKLQRIKDKSYSQNFFESDSKYWSQDGYFIICKEHLREIVYDIYFNEAMLNMKDAFYIACMRFDLPYNETLIESSMSRLEKYGDDIKKFISKELGAYIGNCNSFGKKNNSTTEFDYVGVLKSSDAILDQDTENKQTLSREILTKWGDNWSYNQYIRLENFYSSMCDKNEIETPQDEDYVKKIVALSIQIDDAIANKDSGVAKQLGDLYSKYMSDAKFRAQDMTDADKQGGLRSFSHIYKEVEKKDFIPPWEKYAKKYGVKQDIVDKVIMHIENFTLRFNNAERMVEPPSDTPKLEDDAYE